MTKRKKLASSRDGPLVIGRNAVREVLRHRSERAKCLLVASPSRKGPMEEIFTLSEGLGLPCKEICREELEELAHSGSHQGVALEVKQREFSSVEDILGNTAVADRSLVLALDGVQDPQNVGAILRAAECFGVDGVLWSKNRGPKVTATVSKVSVGASELLNLVPVSNLSQALDKFKDAGYWTVAAMIGEGASSLESFDWPEKTVILLGAEGSGIRNRTARESDFQVYIPMSGHIDSLNVSQASALLLYACKFSQSSSLSN